MPIVWEMQEPGWWTSEIGGLCAEGSKWFFWPKTLSTPKRLGPWKTLKDAKQRAEVAALPNGERDGKV